MAGMEAGLEVAQEKIKPGKVELITLTRVENV